MLESLTLDAPLSNRASSDQQWPTIPQDKVYITKLGSKFAHQNALHCALWAQVNSHNIMTIFHTITDTPTNYDTCCHTPSLQCLLVPCTHFSSGRSDVSELVNRLHEVHTSRKLHFLYLKIRSNSVHSGRA